MTTLAILGASGHGRVIADAALSSGNCAIVEFYDDAWPTKIQNGQYPIVGNTASLLSLTSKPAVIVAIGHNSTRLSKQAELLANGFELATIIHPKAYISASAIIAAGTVLMPGAVVNADSVIGSGCIINSNAVVEHDCALEDGVHLSPSASLAGGVLVGQCSWIGIGASVIQLKRIGRNVVVGAGASVITDLPDNITAVGVPAKIVNA